MAIKNKREKKIILFFTIPVVSRSSMWENFADYINEVRKYVKINCEQHANSGFMTLTDKMMTKNILGEKTNPENDIHIKVCMYELCV